MNRYQSTVAAIAFVAALWPVPGSAQGLENERSLAVTVGTGLSLSGNVIEQGAGPINGTPSVFVEQAYSNHFSDALRLRVTGGMGLDYNKEAFLSFAYDKINGTERVTGSSGGYPLYTRFSNTKAIDIEGGVRYYFLPEGPTRTYIAGVGGIRFHDPITATIRVLELGLTLSELDYFKSSTLFIFGTDAGLTRDLNDTLAVGAEIGLRFQPGLSPAPLFPGTTLSEINHTGSRWSLPISVSATWKFK